jgi:hypothetical protein
VKRRPVLTPRGWLALWGLWLGVGLLTFWIGAHI